MTDKKELLQALEETRDAFEEAFQLLHNEQEEYWNSLSKEDQLKVFCAVIRRIMKGDLVERRSYRGVLYGIFGFGPEAYGAAQDAGYLTIHNALYDWVDWQEKGEGPDDWK